MMNRKDWFYSIVLIFLFLFVINIFGILITNDSFAKSFHFSSSQLKDLLSVIVSCISILLTGFFSVLAIDAYGKIRDIKKEAEEAKAYRDTAFSSLLEIGTSELLFFENIIQFIEKTIQLNNEDEKTRNKYKKWRDSTYRQLYRLGLTPFLLNKEKRVEFISRLTSFAEVNDWKKIEEIANSPTEPEEIKKIAKVVLLEKNKQSSSASEKTSLPFCKRLKKAKNILLDKE